MHHRFAGWLVRSGHFLTRGLLFPKDSSLYQVDIKTSHVLSRKQCPHWNPPHLLASLVLPPPLLWCSLGTKDILTRGQTFRSLLLSPLTSHGPCFAHHCLPKEPFLAKVEGFTSHGYKHKYLKAVHQFESPPPQWLTFSNKATPPRSATLYGSSLQRQDESMGAIPVQTTTDSVSYMLIPHLLQYPKILSGISKCPLGWNRARWGEFGWEHCLKYLSLCATLLLFATLSLETG